MKSVADEHARVMAKTLASNMDDLTRQAVRRYLDLDPVADVDDAIRRHGSVSTTLSGIVTFSYDGVELLRIWPVKFGNDLTDGKMVVHLTRQYQFLQENKL